ncbi:MAG TPA: tRNA pseudouridine(38-40) synthase TruA [Candidatus Acidoferrales bacterium]|nr:tRNA pseudouridine(38-40) synthase TruA [Candidatus Acidoferrales bacterium]
MRNIALLVEYDGTAYNGWQIQKNGRSIQATIEKALSKILQEKIKIIGAGRTDAGVHAAGQVANFHARSNMEAVKIAYALNGILPQDIAIRKAADVSDDFHSRFDAKSRVYVYRITRRKAPLMRHYAAFSHIDLSIDLMNQASAFLIGEKNFKSFTKYADQRKRFVCGVTKAEWRGKRGNRREEPEVGESGAVPLSPGSVLVFEIEADRFLHGMVRAIVGTLIDVGRMKISVEGFKNILNCEDRSMARMSAPACGLCLEEVRYGLDIWRQK